MKKLTLEREDRDKERPSLEKIIIMMSQIEIENERYYIMVLILKKTNKQKRNRSKVTILEITLLKTITILGFNWTLIVGHN